MTSGPGLGRIGALHGLDLVSTLALVLTAAAVTGVLSHRFRQPTVLGYLIAGFLIGPNLGLLPLVADSDAVHALSSLGVILLMFSLGLELSVRRVITLATRAGVTAAVEISFTAWLGFVAARALGWGTRESLFAGALVAISSSMILFKTFEERKVGAGLRELVFGVLIFEDLAAIVMIALLSAVAAGEELTFGGAAVHALGLVAFVAALTAVGLFIVPRAVRYVVRRHARETVLVASVGLCFGAAFLARRFGYSEALGAFLAGALAAESGEARILRPIVLPVRELFAAIFFVSVGMMFDPALLVDAWPAVLALTAAVFAGKTLGVSLGALVAGYPTQTAVRAGLSMAQIGEFSFLIAGVGLALGGQAEHLVAVAVSVSLLTTVTTPWMVRFSAPLARRAEESLPRRLRLFATLWATWLEDLRGRPAWSGGAAEPRRLALIIVADAAILCALIIGVSVTLPGFVEKLAGWTGVAPGLLGAGLIVIAVLACAPFGLGVYRAVRRLGGLLAERAVPLRAGLDLGAAPRRALTAGLQFALFFVVGAPVLALTQPFLPAAPGVGFLIVGTSVLAWLLWRGAADLQGHVRAGAQVVLETLARQTSKAQPNLAHASELLPGLGELNAVTVRPGDAAVDRSLADLDLRGHSGAGVLFVSRDGKAFLPTASDTVQAGDTLVLAGDDEAKARAEAFLRKGGPEA